MSTIEFKVRKIKTGETLVATLDSFTDALTFLKERPEFMEVLGVLSRDLTPEQDKTLRAVMRPYSDEEKAVIAESEREAAEQIKQTIEKETKEAEQRKREYAESMAEADPHRPMTLRWQIDDGLSIADPYDQREITDAAKKALEDWIAERNTWVADRGQMVVEATVTVYPGPVPSGMEMDRVQHGGQFVPGLKPDTPEA